MSYCLDTSNNNNDNDDNNNINNNNNERIFGVPFHVNMLICAEQVQIQNTCI